MLVADEILLWKLKVTSRFQFGLHCLLHMQLVAQWKTKQLVWEHVIQQDLCARHAAKDLNQLWALIAVHPTSCAAPRAMWETMELPPTGRRAYMSMGPAKMMTTSKNSSGPVSRLDCVLGLSIKAQPLPSVQAVANTTLNANQRPSRRIDRRQCAVSWAPKFKLACQSDWCLWQWEATVRMQP